MVNLSSQLTVVVNDETGVKLYQFRTFTAILTSKRHFSTKLRIKVFNNTVNVELLEPITANSVAVIRDSLSSVKVFERAIFTATRSSAVITEVVKHGERCLGDLYRFIVTQDKVLGGI